MQATARRAVSPIIATLLLIAIAVAAGIIVYVYVNSLAGGLTGSGGSQVSEQLSMDSYNFKTTTSPVITLRNTGGASVTITQIFFDGNVCTGTAGATDVCGAPTIALPTLGTTQTTTVSLTVTQPGLPATGYTAGTTHTIKIITADGGTFTYSVTAGRSG
ncbi:MAG: type IV pilin [Nitrososphaerota archaeon]|jgi:flagellin-like protein|nr:type IV pilin [Nitrososphaerota archaeon]